MKVFKLFLCLVTSTSFRKIGTFQLHLLRGITHLLLKFNQPLTSWLVSLAMKTCLAMQRPRDSSPPVLFPSS